MWTKDFLITLDKYKNIHYSLRMYSTPKIRHKNLTFVLTSFNSFLGGNNGLLYQKN